MKFQPHPPWTTILKTILTSIDSLEITKTPGYSLFVTGRTCDSLRAVQTLKPQSSWYFPEYICADPILTLQKDGAKIHYYPLKDDLTPDFEKIKPDADSFFVFVQYFGRETDLTLARSFCDQHRLLLVEDGAHLLRKKQKVISDFTVFSPYKTYGLPTGGLLLAHERHHLSQSQTTSHEHIRDSKWLVKRFLEDIAPDSFTSRRKKSLMPTDPFSNQAVTAPIKTKTTPLSFKLIHQNLGESEALARRNNFQILLRQVGRLPHWMPENLDAPYWYPVEFKDQQESLRYYNLWNQKTWVLQSWPDLPADATPHARKLKESVLFLPVHSGVKTEKVFTSINCPI